MADIWRVLDRLGREVVLTEAGWAHILVGHGDDLAGRESDVQAAIERAETITFDAKHARRECHYVRIGPGRRRLKVVVGYAPVPPPGTWAGTVVTAYLVGGVEPKERPRWP